MLSEFENLPSLNNEFYSVAFTDIDYMQSDIDVIGEIRKKFFENHKRIKNKVFYNSGSDKLKFSYDLQEGSNLKWRKMRNDVLEELGVDDIDGYAIETYSIIDRKLLKKTFFNKQHQWIKTYYFNEYNRKSPFLILEPVVYDDNDTIKKTTIDTNGNKTEEILSPFPVSSNDYVEYNLSEMSGQPEIYCTMTSGKFHYCSDDCYNKRTQALRMLICEYSDIDKDEINDSDYIDDEYDDEYYLNDEESIVKESSISTDEVITDNILDETNENIETFEDEFINNGEIVEDKETIENLENLSQNDKGSNVQYIDACIIGNCPLYPLPKKIINVSEEERYCYYGEIVDGNRCGYGRTIMNNGITAYEGNYKDDMRNGYGTYYYKSGKLCYVGNWKDNKKNGVGIAVNAKDDSICIGNWSNDMLNGATSHFDKNGNLIYSGTTKNGKKNGAGITYNNFNGNILIGKWQDGVFMDYCTEISTDGVLIYSGGYRNNMRNGYGTLYDLDGNVMYIGNWKDNKYDGEGKLYLKDGKIIEGTFIGGVVSGKATETNIKGFKIYEGEWENNLYNGIGRKYFKNGGYCEGKFKDGETVGIMSGYNSNGNIVYVGEYKDDLPNGSGICYKNGKKEYEGNFVNGIKNGNGKLFDDDKCYYIGQMFDNMQNGYGESYCDDIISYKGTWEKGMYNGYGILYENGQPKYIGEFSYDKMNGRINEIKSGKVIKECIYIENECVYMREYSETDTTLIYEGNVQNNQRNGMGCSFLSYGEKSFEGIFKNNEPSKSMKVSLQKISDLPYCKELENTDYDKYRKCYDFAVELNINGGIYSGNLSMGKPSGKGTILYSDHRYTGKFLDGTPFGDGIIYTNSGEEIKGIFRKDTEQDTKNITFSGGIVYYYSSENCK